MNKQKSYTVKRIASLLVSAMYLFIVVAYLFFTPKFQYKHPSGITKAKPNTQVIYNLIRTSRCMVGSNKPGRIMVKQHILHAVPLKANTSSPSLYYTSNTRAIGFVADHHSVYLANRVLRI
jgi:hypothetical protein